MDLCLCLEKEGKEKKVRIGVVWRCVCVYVKNVFFCVCGCRAGCGLTGGLTLHISLQVDLFRSMTLSVFFSSCVVVHVLLIHAVGSVSAESLPCRFFGLAASIHWR